MKGSHTHAGTAAKYRNRRRTRVNGVQIRLLSREEVTAFRRAIKNAANGVSAYRRVPLDER